MALMREKREELFVFCTCDWVSSSHDEQSWGWNWVWLSVQMRWSMSFLLSPPWLVRRSEWQGNSQRKKCWKLIARILLIVAVFVGKLCFEVTDHLLVDVKDDRSHLEEKDSGENKLIRCRMILGSKENPNESMVLANAVDRQSPKQEERRVMFTVRSESLFHHGHGHCPPTSLDALLRSIDRSIDRLRRPSPWSLKIWWAEWGKNLCIEPVKWRSIVVVFQVMDSLSLLVNAVSTRQQSNKDKDHPPLLLLLFWQKIIVHGLTNGNEPSMDLLEMFTDLTGENQVLSESVLARWKSFEPSIGHRGSSVSIVDKDDKDREHAVFHVLLIDEVDRVCWLTKTIRSLVRLADQLLDMEWMAQSSAMTASARPYRVRRPGLDSRQSTSSLRRHSSRDEEDRSIKWFEDLHPSHSFCARFHSHLGSIDHHDMICTHLMKHERNISPTEGVVQASTTWSAGLHRFLPIPIKHGRKLTTELSVTTNSLSRSNIGRFTRYGKNIFALRGTLGFKDARDLLHRISEDRCDDHSSSCIPTETTHSIEDNAHYNWPWVAENDRLRNKQSWPTRTRSLAHLSDPTGCEDDQQTNPTSWSDLSRSPLHGRTTPQAVESNVVGNEIPTGEIIVPTNLPGRGRDLKTSASLENHRGWHVCVPDVLPEQPPSRRTSFRSNLSLSSRLERNVTDDSQSRWGICTIDERFSEKDEYRRANLRRSARDDPGLARTNWTSPSRTAVERRYQAERWTISTLLQTSRPISKVERQRLSTAPCERRMGSLAGNRWMMSHRIVWIFVSFWSLERQGLTSEDVTQDGHRFFHALEGEGELTVQQIKDQVIEHMIDHPEPSKNVIKRRVNEALKMNLIIFRTDSLSPQISQQEDAVHTYVSHLEGTKSIPMTFLFDRVTPAMR